MDGRMKYRTLWVLSILFLIAAFLTGCQRSIGLIFSQPTATPIPPTFTATLAPTPTDTSTPTITPTAIPTLTPTPSLVEAQGGTIQAPILLYHHVAVDAQGNRYYIDPARFEEQMKWLSDNGYQTITVTQLADLIRNGGQIPRRPVVITFDDGNEDIYANAYPILKKYHFVATFYVVDGYINGKDMVTTDQLKDLIQNGWEIGCHSKHHVDLSAEGVDLGDEIRLAKLDMEKRLGIEINSFAYPFGDINDSVISHTVNYGYTSAVGLGSSTLHSLNNIYYLDRIEIQNAYTMDQFKAYLPWSGPLQ
jgi:peptidoglycan/xylan/chitin deacetylase (PgdA/CDA1 family)